MEIHQEASFPRGARLVCRIRFAFSFALDLKSEIKQELFYKMF